MWVRLGLWVVHAILNFSLGLSKFITVRDDKSIANGTRRDRDGRVRIDSNLKNSIRV